MLEQVLKRIEDRRDQAVAGLTQLLQIPSMSAKPEHASDCRRCAEHLAGALREAKLSADVRETGGHPIVLAKNAHQAGRTTVLLYGHYDVQPAEPLELWESPPFEPTVRPDASGHQAVFARGASDDNGPVWAHIEAIRAWTQAAGELPVNLTVLLEGEEEIGSEHLERFVEQHRDELKADVAVISDTSQFARGLPAIVYGLRGLVYVEVFLTGPSHDLHSGLFGGAVPNPANILCQMLGGLHDASGRVTIPGFYDDVVPLTEAEREMWRKLPFDEGRFLSEIGLSAGMGEAGFSMIEQRWARPTCDINGLTAGYQGAGAKTVIGAKASAKLSCRLVPNQDPAKIEKALLDYLRQRCPASVKIEFAHHGGSPGVLVPHDSPAVKLASEAIATGFGAKPVLMREGGSIPVVGLIKRQLGIDTLLVGFGLPDDRIHSPNEKMDLASFHQGVRTAAALYERLAKLA
jgi:acetylornithine deacetylase/succinyl-diaminopimelate desuccinylase-like protein